MADPPKFSFSTASGASPFGAAKSSGVGTPSLFGTAGTTASFSGFGNGNTNNGGSAGTPSLFGASSAQSTSGTTAGSTASFSWGAPPASTNAPSSTTTTSAPNLFGSTTPAASKTSGFSFGSTTPAGEPPAATGLGASTGATATSQNASASSTLFGGGKNLFGQSSTPAATPAKPLFGSQTQNTPQTGNLFGGQGAGTGQSTNIFAGLGQAKSDATNPASTTPAVTAPTFSFHNQQPATKSNNVFSPSTGGTPASAQTGQKPLFDFPSAGSSSGSNLATTATAEASSQKGPTFSFPTASSSAETAPKTAFSGFNLGGPAQSTPASSSAATSNTTTAGPLFSFPATSTSTAQPASSVPTASPFPSFAPSAASSSTSQAATAAPTFPSLNVGGASTSATTQAPLTTSAAPATSRSSQPAAPSGLTASTCGPAPPSQSRLKNKTMDEILTRWATDLTKYTKEFRSTAETVATWDQHLVDNMSKISKLYSQTLTAERQTESVEMQLSAVENQQAELESWLTVYEKQVDEMLERENKGGQGEVGGPDSERERTYRLSEKLGERLEEMGTDLESMVGEINAANSSLSRNGKQDEPITQIVRILNSHLTQLKAIDDGAAALNAKVEKAQKSIGSLGYSNGGMEGNGSAAVDDFYKSYLGRRG